MSRSTRCLVAMAFVGALVGTSLSARPQPGEPSAPRPREVTFSRPPKGPTELERIAESMRRFDQVMEDAIRVHLDDARDVAAVRAYRDAAARKLHVVSDASGRGRTGAAVTFQVSRCADTGKRWLAEVVPAIDLALSDELCARANRGEPLYLDLLHALLVKEGAMIVEAQADPTPKLEHSALAEAFRRRPFDVRDPAARETALRLVAHEVEGEAVGYRVAVEFLARRGLGPETLRDAAGREPDYWLRTMLMVFGELLRLHMSDAGEGTDRELSFKGRLFELEATELSNESTRAVLEIIRAEGAVASHRDEKRLVRDAALGFLVDPRYVRGTADAAPATRPSLPSPPGKPWWSGWWVLSGLTGALALALGLRLRKSRRRST